jgi:proteic killer suppression protein
MLDAASELTDLDVLPGNHLRRYAGIAKANTASGLTTSFECFTWRGGDAFDVEIADYH